MLTGKEDQSFLGQLESGRHTHSLVSLHLATLVTRWPYIPEARCASHYGMLDARILSFQMSSLQASRMNE